MRLIKGPIEETVVGSQHVNSPFEKKSRSHEKSRKKGKVADVVSGGLNTHHSDEKTTTVDDGVDKSREFAGEKSRRITRVNPSHRQT